MAGILELLQRRDLQKICRVFNCDYIVSCIGMPGFKARFFGVYRVAGHRRQKRARSLRISCI